MSEKIFYVPGRIKSAVKGGYATGAEDIIDDELGKEQSAINQERINDIEQLREDTQEDIQRVEDKVDEIGDAIQFDEDGDLVTLDGDDFSDSESRAKIPTIGAIKAGADTLGIIYDVSAANKTSGGFASYLSLNNAINAIDVSERKSGLNIKYIDQSTGQYVYYTYIGNDTNNFTNIDYWINYIGLQLDRVFSKSVVVSSGTQVLYGFYNIGYTAIVELLESTVTLTSGAEYGISYRIDGSDTVYSTITIGTPYIIKANKPILNVRIFLNGNVVVTPGEVKLQISYGDYLKNKNLTQSISEEWKPNTYYPVGRYCMFNNARLRAKIPHTSSSVIDYSKFDTENVDTSISQLNDKTEGENLQELSVSQGSAVDVTFNIFFKKGDKIKIKWEGDFVCDYLVMQTSYDSYIMSVPFGSEKEYVFTDNTSYVKLARAGSFIFGTGTIQSLLEYGVKTVEFNETPHDINEINVSAFKQIAEQNIIDNNTANQIPIPVVNVGNIVEVETKEELITELENISADKTIKLIADINLNEVVEISSNNNSITIDSNNHKITGVTELNKIGEENGYSKFVLSQITTPSICFLLDVQKTIELDRSKNYIVDGQITQADGTPFVSTDPTDPNHSTHGSCRFKLPANLYLTYDANRPLYVNITTMWTSAACLVTNIADGYIYFNYSGLYHINADYLAYGHNARFFIINWTEKNAQCFLFNNVLFCKGSINNVGIYDAHSLFKIDGCNKVKIINTSFYGYGVLRIINQSNVIVENCVFDGGINSMIRNETQSICVVTNCKFKNSAWHCIESNQGCSLIVDNCEFNDTGYARANSAAIHSQGKSWIKNNHIENYGYCGISVGMGSTTTDPENDSIIEFNELVFTDKYFVDAVNFVPSDSGAIYCNINETNCVVRNNKIINYRGIFSNNGIYLDDGCFNVVCCENLVIGITNAYSINCRRDENANFDTYIPNAMSTNRYIYHNIVGKEINFGGRGSANNNCYLGYNIIDKNTMARNNKIELIPDVEQQYITQFISYKLGVPILKADVSIWNFM